jgi:importin-5
VLALEAETIQNVTAKKVVDSAKVLVQKSGINAEQILVQLGEDGQRTVRSFFS